MNNTFVFLLIMAGAVLIGVALVVLPDLTLARREERRWGDDYEGGFGSGYERARDD